jgi:hypothetical protein
MYTSEEGVLTQSGEEIRATVRLMTLLFFCKAVRLLEYKGSFNKGCFKLNYKCYV